MLISLYNFDKRINSTKTPTGAGFQRNVTLKDGTSIYAPVFILNDFDTDYNYIKWDNRYYFISDIEYTRMNLFTVTCNIDLLRTYQNVIYNSTAFVLYSRSRYNVNISDRRLRTEPTAIYRSTSAVLFNASSAFSSGTYIVQYVTSRPTVGPSGVVWLTPARCRALAETLSDPGFIESDAMEKELLNAYNAVISCRYVPFTWTSPADTNIFLGSYSSPVRGGIPIPRTNYSTNIAIPWAFSDFRNNSDYTTFLLFLPGYGLVDIRPEDVRGLTSLPVKLSVDGITGEGTYIVGDIFKGTCNFGISVSIGTISGNNVGAATGILNAGVSAAMGNIFGAIASGTSAAINMFQRNIGNNGTLGGLSPIFASIGENWNSVYMVCISHDTTVDPDNIRAAQGRPLNRSAILGELSGYVQTLNRSVSTGIDFVSNEINRLLDGGVYLE